MLSAPSNSSKCERPSTSGRQTRKCAVATAVQFLMGNEMAGFNECFFFRLKRKRKGCSWKVAHCIIHFTVKPLHWARTFSSSATQGIGRVPALGKLKKRVAHLCSDKPTLEIAGNLQGLLDKPPRDWDRAIHLEVCNSRISKIPGLVKPGTSAWQWHFLGLFSDHLHSHRFGGRCFCFSCQSKVGAHAMTTFPSTITRTVFAGLH